MTLQELNEKRNGLIADAEAMVATIEQEVRKFTEEEQVNFDAIKKNLDEVNEEIRAKELEIAKLDIESRKVENKNTNDNSTMNSFLQEIQNCVKEKRSATLPIYTRAINANDENGGGNAVALDIYEIVKPLREDSTLAKLGVTMLTGLKANESFPIYSGANAAFVAEGEDIPDGEGTLTKNVLSPKIISAKVILSNQMLLQDAAGLETLVKQDLIDAVNDTLEAAVFGEGDSDNGKKPEGVFYNVDQVDANYDTICSMEEALENANVKGDVTFVVSPTAKRKFKQASISGGRSDVRMIYTDGEIDGYNTIVSSHAKGVAVGDWKDMICGIWENGTVLVDPYTNAGKNQTILYCTLYANTIKRHANAIVAKKLN